MAAFRERSVNSVWQFMRLWARLWVQPELFMAISLSFSYCLSVCLSFSLSHNLFFSVCLSLSENEEKPNVEVIILVCTGAAATFLWLMLILFIRKLRKVGRSNRCCLFWFFFFFFFLLHRNPNMWKVQKVIEVICVVKNFFSIFGGLFWWITGLFN